MLHQIWNLNKYGVKRTRIVHSEKSSIGFSPKGFGNHMGVSLFKYKYHHELIPPCIYVIDEIKRVPGIGEVHPLTTLNDIDWIKPKKKKAIKTTYKFKSSSSDTVYKANKIESGGEVTYTCNCRGYFMKKDKKQGCTHIQQIKNKE